MFVLYFCAVLSYVGRGLCDGLSSRPKESYRGFKNRLRNLPCEEAKGPYKDSKEAKICLG
jgi:hypothetical protein